MNENSGGGVHSLHHRHDGSGMYDGGGVHDGSGFNNGYNRGSFDYRYDGCSFDNRDDGGGMYGHYRSCFNNWSGMSHNGAMSGNGTVGDDWSSDKAGGGASVGQNGSNNKLLDLINKMNQPLSVYLPICTF